MKKFLFFIIFTVITVGFSVEMKAQTARTVSSQKTDDGVLVAYPNPTKDVLLLRSKDIAIKIKTVTFFSILGAQVAEYNINSNNTELRLDKLRPGKYLMRYTLDDNTQKITQIIKQ
ncbi:T9SS type A sorting domain-containing protein [Epilithonimonas sp.]|uniref:T9SS type A sorting domain-containing protein n=1 Tax=Epilithonimonas sp. TaxID=2894511 RepID=UPI00289B8783|nr:T9SS type A sorting domain-containing protein [Epilithonimonas sp.]